ncbi:MAG: LysE family translocator [Caulobacteraceae bacterium]
MTLQSYLLFVAASFVLAITPGPDMLYLLGRSVAQGKRAGVIAVLGINLGACIHLTAAVTGLSAILATSAVAFSVVKLIGAAYLIYLGVRTLLSPRRGPVADHAGRNGTSMKAVFWQGVLSNALNPKVALFFLALLPQFIQPNSGSPTLQLLGLGLTVNIIGLVVCLTLVALSTTVTTRLRRSSSVAAWLQKALGVMFVGLGLKLATEHR